MIETNGKHKLIAIDGNSLLYRAFFAMRHLSTAEGQPTNAVYGFTMMLLRILQEERPDSIVVAFDAPVKTFRHEEYDGYKAHRKPTPDELISQGPIARRLVETFNIPIIEIPGYEADDVVGTIAKQASAEGYETIIVTGDLDALQLVTDSVKVMTTVKGVTETVIYDEQAVEDRYGIKPEYIPDFKALKGDPSDNIPGVPGIGDKSATKLIQEWGSVESLLEHIDDISDPKLKAKMQNATDQAVLSKFLATIVTDVPLGLTIEECKLNEPDYDHLRALFRELEFRTLIKRLPQPESATELISDEVPLAELGSSTIIENTEQLNELMAKLKSFGRFAIRTHTVNGKPTESSLLGIAFSTGQNETAYIRIDGGTSKPEETGLLLFDDEDTSFSIDLSAIKDVLESSDIKKFGHDIKNDCESLKLRNVKLSGIDFDTMLGAYVLDSTRSNYKIAEVAFEQVRLELPFVDVKSKSDAQPMGETVICAEAESIWRLVPVIQSKLEQKGMLQLYHDVELPLAQVLADVELRGVAIDTSYLGKLSIRLNEQIRALEQEIYDIADHQFNIASPKQLQTVLFEEMGLPSGKKTKTGLSTDADTLQMLSVDYPIVAKVLHWRELSKLKSTYADALPKLINQKTGRIHTSLNQGVTVTGRLSSSEPNLQNIPIRTELGREIRAAFVSTGENLLVSADYSQIELRILAHVTGDEELMRAFINNEDVHVHTAASIFSVPEDEVTSDMRRQAKTVNFAVIYGMSDFGLARELGIGNRDAREYIERYFAKFPGVRTYTDETVEFARENGFVTTPMGRRRYVPEIHSGNRNLRLFAERAAVNMPIQGAAADIMKLAMIAVDSAIEGKGLATQMVLQVHDELVFEVPPSELDTIVSLVKELMQGVYPLKVPLIVDVKVGKNWAEMNRVY